MLSKILTMQLRSSTMTAWALVEKVLPDGSPEKWSWDGIALVARGNDIYVNEPHAARGNYANVK